MDKIRKYIIIYMAIINLNLPWELILLLSVITLSEALGQYLLRLSKTYPKLWWLPFCTWALYGLCTYLLLQTYQYTTMGKAEVYWDALSAIIVPIIGIYAFNNKLTIINWIGIGLVCIGTLMLAFKPNTPILGQAGGSLQLLHKIQNQQEITPSLGDIFNPAMSIIDGSARHTGDEG